VQSLRRFFLLEHGDFFIQFMDVALTELRRDAKELSLARLQVWKRGQGVHEMEVSYVIFLHPFDSWCHRMIWFPEGISTTSNHYSDLLSPQLRFIVIHF